MVHLTVDRLQAGLNQIRTSPPDRGRLELITRRPAVGERETLEEGFLTLEDGLVGDTWLKRTGFDPSHGSPNTAAQVTMMNSRAIALIAGSPERWSLAGDQLYVDLDLSVDNLPAGTRLAVGEAVIEVTGAPHRGCQKFSSRFGLDALRFVNSEEGRYLRLRGLNARVVEPGSIRRGELVRKEA
jgi:MOSC domain-containing protein YiiM